VVKDEEEALARVLEPGFDPAAIAVLETDPGISPAQEPTTGTARYRELEPEDVRIEVEAPAAAIVVVRNAWDEGWTATVDGAPAPVLHADHLLQGVAVPAGSHEVRLAYREPAIGLGLLLSSVAWLGFGVALGVALARGRQPSGTTSASASTSEDPGGGAAGSTGA
jgi:hypothetical protein